MEITILESIKFCYQKIKSESKRFISSLLLYCASWM